jgi:hypothetical protein
MAAHDRPFHSLTDLRQTAAVEPAVLDLHARAAAPRRRWQRALDGEPVASASSDRVVIELRPARVDGVERSSICPRATGVDV